HCKRQLSSKSHVLDFSSSEKFMCSIESCACSQLQIQVDFHARGMNGVSFDAYHTASRVTAIANANFHRNRIFLIFLAYEKFLCSIGSCACSQLQIQVDFHVRGMIGLSFDSPYTTLFRSTIANANCHPNRMFLIFLHLKNSCARSRAARAANCKSRSIS